MVISDLSEALVSVPQGRHLAGMVQGPDDRAAVVRAFVSPARDSGTRLVWITGDQGAGEAEAELTAAGLDLARLGGEGRLAVRALDLERSERGAVEEAVAEELGRLEPHHRLRVVLDVAALLDEAGVDGDQRLVAELVAAGRRLDQAGRGQLMALYQRDRLPPSTLLRAINIHPLLVLDGALVGNCHVLPDPLLDISNDQQAQLEGHLHNLRGNCGNKRVLKRERDFAAAVLDTMDALVIVLDREGRIVRFNGACERTTGYQRHEVLGRPFWEIFLFAEEEQAVREVFGRLRGGDFPSRHENAWRTKSGSRRVIQWSNSALLDGDGAVEYVIGTGIDITARKQAEQLLAWEASVNAAVAELARSMIGRSSLEEISMRVLDKAKELTGSTLGYVGHIDPESGYLVSSTLTRDVWDQCQVADKQTVFDSFVGLWAWPLRNRMPLLVNDVHADPRSHGVPQGHVPVDRFLSAPALLDTELLGQVALANSPRDYTGRDLELVERLSLLFALAVERHRDEETLRQRSATLAAQNQELDAYARTVAHDLKTPLTTITGFTQLLLDQDADVAAAAAKRYLEMIEKSARKMNGIIEALLLLARVRRTEVELEPLEMSALVEEVMERLLWLRTEVDGEMVLPERWPRAKGYGPWVEEVWANYLTNALKYGGSPPRVELGADPPRGGKVRFWVRDQGPGLSDEDRCQLFAPFTQLARTGKGGHGLGLSIVQRIVTKLGGEVGVENEPGQGATFYFTLPAA